MFVTLFINLNEQEVGTLFRDFEDHSFGIGKFSSVGVVQGVLLLC
jgi:hypothetical protein